LVDVEHCDESFDLLVILSRDINEECALGIIFPSKVLLNLHQLPSRIIFCDVFHV